MFENIFIGLWWWLRWSARISDGGSNTVGRGRMKRRSRQQRKERSQRQAAREKSRQRTGRTVQTEGRSLRRTGRTV